MSTATVRGDRSGARREGLGRAAAGLPLGLGSALTDGTVVEANDALARLLGLPDASHLLGTSLAHFHRFPELAADVIAERLEEGAVEGLELDARRADGEPITVRIHAWAEERAGEAPLVHFSMEDVTELSEERQLLSHGLKMEAVVRFAAGVAHEYNNLLTTIIGEARQLLDDHPESSEAREVIRTARRAAEITRRLLVFSTSEVARNTVVNANEVVRAVAEAVREEVGDDVEVVVRTEEPLPTVFTDPAHLRQCLDALVGNALDAMPGGGRLVFETSIMDAPLDTEGLDFDRPVPPGRYVSVAVGDNGIGMNQETRRRIFDPFFTTKPLGGGAGLGLTTVYGHVLRAGGHVSVISAPAHGTVVRILLPMHGAAPTAPPRDTSPQALAVPDTGTVLVVDDEPSLVRIMTRVLERFGYDVLTARDGHEAQAVVAEHDGPLDLLVTDVMMPHMRGTELAAWFRSARPDAAVLLVSGYTDSSEVQEWVDADPDVFLAKPFEPEEFLEAVRKRLAARGDGHA